MENWNAENNEVVNQDIVENNQEIDRILSISLASKTNSSSNLNQQQQQTRYCWVCFATEDDEDSEGHEWIKPCNCN